MIWGLKTAIFLKHPLNYPFWGESKCHANVSMVVLMDFPEKSSACFGAVSHHDLVFTDFGATSQAKARLVGLGLGLIFLEKCPETADLSLMLGGIHVKKSGGVLNQISYDKIACTSDDN